MHAYRKVMVAVLVASAMLAALASSAVARNYLITPEITATWTSLTFSGGGASISCEVSLSGRFHERTLTKVTGSLVGFITSATIRRPCLGGTAWAYSFPERNEVLGNTAFPNSLPWHLTYEGFSGTLPNITTVRTLLEGMRFQLRATVFGITLLCDYTTGVFNGGNATLIRERESGGVITNVRASGTIRSSSGGFCPTGSLSGIGTLSRTFGGRVTIVLI